MRFPQIVEAAVIGIPDDLQGEAVKVFLVHAKRTVSIENDLREFAIRSLPPHLIPKEFVFLDSLPKNESGKVLKSRLRELDS